MHGKKINPPSGRNIAGTLLTVRVETNGGKAASAIIPPPCMRQRKHYSKKASSRLSKIIWAIELCQ
jgi:hypothetical protein